MIISQLLTSSRRKTVRAIAAAFDVFSAVAAFAQQGAPAGEVQLRLRPAPQAVLAAVGAQGMRFPRCLRASFTTRLKRNCWRGSRCSASRNPRWTRRVTARRQFRDIEAMIAACPHVAAIPMIRLPDAQEMRIQHTTEYRMSGRDRADRGRCGSGSGSR